MKSPTNCQVTSRSFYAAGPQSALGPPRANKGPCIGMVFPSTFAKEGSSKRPHCMSCQDKDQGMVLTKAKDGKGQSCEPCGIPQAEQFSPADSSRQALPEASVHLRKCLSLAGLDMTVKHRQGRNFGLDCLALSSAPKDMCQDSAIFHKKVTNFKLLSPFRNPAL